ncbi:hypothetical protein SFR_5789 [Streptomyces sp. FR-008]|nr:hypothetical protein SFR_5789 [Streptomyces sp. FR-008]
MTAGGASSRTGKGSWRAPGNAAAARTGEGQGRRRRVWLGACVVSPRPSRRPAGGVRPLRPSRRGWPQPIR